jgi:aspartyl-tRNA(Asn)/glutamyl-tRNA(Gln) amidotransferase subunit A
MLIEKIQSELQNKEYTCMDMVKRCFDKILKENSSLNAIISMRRDDALKEAEIVDSHIKDGIPLKPLEGILFGIKDNILVKDGICTAGSKILEDYVSPLDATVIKKIKEAGGIIIGKTNMDEFAMGSSNETSAFGVCHNPYDLDRVSGGSSGGSASAVSADLVHIALGSDTAGSIRQPASFCGVVGFKPSYGATSRFGLIAMSSSLDVIGPISKYVEDSEKVFKIISGKDELDSTSTDILEFNDNIGSNITIGIPKEYFVSGINLEVEKSVKDFIEKLKTLGFNIVEISLPHTEYSLPAYHIIAPAEISANLARFDNVRYGTDLNQLKMGLGIESLNDLYFKTRGKKFGQEVRRRILIGTYVLSRGFYDAYYLKAQKVRSIITNDFNSVFQSVDFILAPTSPSTAFKIGEKNQDPVSMYLSDIFTVSANLAGLPAISIPLGKDSLGLPIGLQIIGKRNEDLKVLSLAKNLEKQINFS